MKEKRQNAKTPKRQWYVFGTIWGFYVSTVRLTCKEAEELFNSSLRDYDIPEIALTGGERFIFEMWTNPKWTKKDAEAIAKDKATVLYRRFMTTEEV